MTEDPHALVGSLVLGGESESRFVALRVDAGGLHAEARDGHTVTLPFEDLEVSGGGFEGKHVFCRDRRTGSSVASDAPGLAEALEAHHAGRIPGGLGALRAHRRGHRRARLLGFGVVGALVLLGVALLAAAPGLLAASVDHVPLSVDVALGEAVEGQSSEGPEVDDPRIVGPVSAMVERLVAASGADPAYRFRVHVVRSEELNAFALPGGSITVLTGLLHAAATPDEVAGVLAHEIAHVTARHGLREMAHRVGTGAAIALLVGDDEGWVALAGDLGEHLRESGYSRDAEREADAKGVETMTRAGFDPEGLARFFERLAAEGDAMPGALEWISTHPDHAERVARVRALAAELPDRAPVPLEGWTELKAAVADL